MKTRLLFTTACLASTLAFAGGDSTNVQTDSLIQNEFQISFITPMGTPGTDYDKMENEISINIFAGHHGGLNGVEVGGFANSIKHNATGVQVAGYANSVQGHTEGVQASGFLNYSGSLEGVQASGFTNVAKDSVEGAQVTGFTNVSFGKINGLQASGFTNVAMNKMDGIQASGFTNIAQGGINGIQASGFLNYAKSLYDTGVTATEFDYLDGVTSNIQTQ